MNARLSVFLALAVAATLAAAHPAQAKMVPGAPPLRVLVMDDIPNGMFKRFARVGAIGLLRPEIGPTTNRRQSLAELERGAEVNSRLGGVPDGPRLLAASHATGFPTARDVVIVDLPPPGRPVKNDQLYRIAVIGRGFHGLLVSPTTRIPGLVSVVDVVPTVLGRPYTGLSSIPDRTPVADLARLDAQIHGEGRLKYASVFIVAGALILFGLLRLGAVRTAIPAALLASLAVGASAVSNEVAICALFTVLLVAGAFAFARACRSEVRLLALVLGVLVLYALALWRRPEWAAVGPLGPDQNQRFWGIGDQIATLLLAPVLLGAAIAWRRFGALGFAAFALIGFFVMTDNRLGANGGGAIGLGLGLAILGSRLLRRGLLGLLALLGASAATVLAIVLHGLASPGPNHLRSAFTGGVTGFLDVAAGRVPLVYAPAAHNWPLTLPLSILFVAACVYVWRVTRPMLGRDLLLAFGGALLASVVVNDATGYMLAGGIACALSLARFTPDVALRRAPATAPAALELRPAPPDAAAID